MYIDADGRGQGEGRKDGWGRGRGGLHEKRPRDTLPVHFASACVVVVSFAGTSSQAGNCLANRAGKMHLPNDTASTEFRAIGRRMQRGFAGVAFASQLFVGQERPHHPSRLQVPLAHALLVRPAATSKALAPGLAALYGE